MLPIFTVWRARQGMTTEKVIPEMITRLLLYRVC